MPTRRNLKGDLAGGAVNGGDGTEGEDGGGKPVARCSQVERRGRRPKGMQGTK